MRASRLDLALGEDIVGEIKTVRKFSKCSHTERNANSLASVNDVQIVEFVVILFPAYANSLKVVYL
jgi:hypothetical protein